MVQPTPANAQQSPDSVLAGQVAALIARSTVASGVPATVKDKAALQKVAAVIQVAQTQQASA